MNTHSGFTNILYEYLTPSEINILSTVNKEFNEDIKLKQKEKLFEHQISKLPILQSSIHWMGNRDSKPIRYHWLKTDFTPEQKAKINIHLLDNLCEYQMPKHGYLGVVFTLHSNGLMCQLPSNSHIIREYEKETGKIEYTFLRMFVLNTFYDSDVSEKLEYKKISIEVYGSFFFEECPEVKQVIKIMEDYYKEREGKLKHEKPLYTDYSQYLGKYIDNLFGPN